MPSRKSRLRLQADLLTLTRIRSSQPTLVYVLTANKSFKYTYGRSSIAYIGTTKRGLRRVAESVAERAKDILANHGISSLTAHLITCRGRKGAKVWRKLERALIITFRERYGQLPRYNSQGKGWQWNDELKYFSHDAIRSLIDKAAY